MKTLLLMMLFSFTSLAVHAEPKGVRTFNVKKFEFHPSHATEVLEATVTVDYSGKKILMQVVRNSPPCPPGMVCTLALPAPLVVELPITSVQDDSCGVHKVTAMIDERPVDGALQEIKLEDVEDMTCQTFAAVSSKATYTTKIYARMSAQEVEETSKLELELKDEEVPTSKGLSLSSAQLYAGFKKNEAATGGTLEILNDKVTINVSFTTKCDPSTPCPAVQPKKISETLPIVRRTKSTCGERLTAFVRGTNGERMQMDLIDYRNATCKIKVEHQVKAYFQKFQRVSGRSTIQFGLFNFNEK